MNKRKQTICEYSLEGQRALVTGANSGIGRACAIGLAKAGARVGVNYVSGDDSAREVVAEIEALGGEEIALKGDEAETRSALPLLSLLLCFTPLQAEEEAPWWPSRYGHDDQLGSLNEIGAAQVAQAARLVRSGTVVDLGRVLDDDTPKFPGRFWHQTVDVSAHYQNARRPDAGQQGWGINNINWIT